MSIVKNLFRFLILIIIAVAFFNGNYNSDSLVTETTCDDLTSELNYDYPDFSPLNLDLYIQIPSTNSLRQSSNTKRLNSSQKHYLKLLKLYKSRDLVTPNFILQKFSIVHATFIKPFHRMISLGKLVI